MERPVSSADRERTTPPWADVALSVVALIAVAVVLVAHPMPAVAGVAVAASAACLLVAAVVDRRIGRIPNVLVVHGAVFALVACDAVDSAQAWLIGAGLAAVPLLLMHLLDPAALGFGDVKLAAAGGVLVSVVAWPAATLVPLLALIAALARRVVRPRERRAFGPDLVVATFVVLAATGLFPMTGVMS